MKDDKIVSGNDPIKGPAEDSITKECNEIRDFLIEKNRKYGNSALEPVRIFSKASPKEQIFVRLDDKLSRILKGQGENEDVILDIIGYLILLRVQDRQAISNTESFRSNLLNRFPNAYD